MRALTLLQFVVIGLCLLVPVPAFGAVTREEVNRAIKDGAYFLASTQRLDGSWPSGDGPERRGKTALAAIALLATRESEIDLSVRQALIHLDRPSPDGRRTTYEVALATMAFALGDPVKYKDRLVENVQWLERAQIKPRDRVAWPGSWASDDRKTENGDNVSTHYALLGLYTAGELGIPVQDEVWRLSRLYWESGQLRDARNRGAWGTSPRSEAGHASMTCAGISSLIMCSIRLDRGREVLIGGRIRDCGETPDRPLQAALAWLSAHFRVDQNPGLGQLWKYYYLRNLEQVGRLSGLRHFGVHDWYAEGADHLVHVRRRPNSEIRGVFDRRQEGWTGESTGDDSVAATCSALIFLAAGRSSVLVNKSRHGPGEDWNPDANDVRNLVTLVERDWKSRLAWQLVDPGQASLEELREAPILFLNGHMSPEFSAEARHRLREFCEKGGVILADACCSRPDFDRGFRALVRDLFPEPGSELHPLPPDHAIWSRHHELNSGDHPLWGVGHGGREKVIYSPQDLSCFWNQMTNQSYNHVVIKAGRVGQNIIDYVTRRELPPDRLSSPRFP